MLEEMMKALEKDSPENAKLARFIIKHLKPEEEEVRLVVSATIQAIDTQDVAAAVFVNLFLAAKIAKHEQDIQKLTNLIADT